MTRLEEARKELAAEQYEIELCSLGDRPMHPGVKRMQRVEALQGEIRALVALAARPPSAAPPTWQLVIDDMRARDGFGEAKYGRRHAHDNGRDHLRDAYEEALDLACYLRAEIEKRAVPK